MVYLSGKILPAFLGMAATIIIIKQLPPSEYGYYTVYLATGSFLASVGFAWIRMTITRKYELFKHYFSRNDLLSVARYPLGIIGGCVILLGILIPLTNVGGIFLWMALLSVLYGGAQGCFDLLNEFNRVSFRPLSYNFALLLKAVLFLAAVACLFCLGYQQWKAYGVALIVALLVSLVVLVLQQRKERHIQSGGISKKIRNTRIFLGYGVPFSLSLTISFFIFNSDKYIISFFLGSAALGEYSAVASLILIAVNMALSTFTLVWNPTLFRIRKQHGLEFALKKHKEKLVFFILMSVFLVAAGVVIGERFFELFEINNKYSDYWSIAFIATGYAAIYLKVYYCDTYLQLINDSRGVVLNACVLAAASIVLNLLFIGFFGPLGSVASYVLAAIIGALLVRARVQKCQKK